MHNICNLYPQSYILWHITEIEVCKPFLEHELYLSNEAVMGHLPSSLWSILLKTKPFFMHTIFYFSSLFTVLIFFIAVAFI